MREKLRNCSFLGMAAVFMTSWSLSAQAGDSWGRADSFTFEDGMDVLTPLPSPAPGKKRIRAKESGAKGSEPKGLLRQKQPKKIPAKGNKAQEKGGQP
ncbi:MAG: hypothetical protein ING65_14770 [Rhodocyclaceae bacterium]|nr:hypothetical protein [Rhodocyclaceae bacterium]